MNYLTLVRIGIVCAIVVLLIPVTLHAVSYEDDLGDGRVATDFGGRNDTLFVTTQGTATLNGSKAKALAIDTGTGDVVWSHTRYERYFDVEPISEDRVLFLGAEGPHGANMWVNVVNWRTGEVHRQFRVPDDVHDVDPMGDDRYAVADIENDRVYVYDYEANETVWQYRFRDRFPSDVGGDPDDWTHLNDVDVFDDGSTFLVSPRNFDRVMLINRSQKRTEWTLGEEDNYDVLNEQHNPALLSRNPPTVLVADSENDRVIEYRKNGSEWEQVWAYRGDLTWPREADRLPNGNTLVVDSNGQRVLEVTPGREVVWELSVTKNPYDADLLSLGDEPTGPSMVEFRSEFDGPEAEATPLDRVASRITYPVELLQWVVPWNIRFGDFLNLFGAVILGGFLLGGEAHRRLRARGVTERRRLRANGTVAIGVGAIALGVGGYLLARANVQPLYPWLWQSVGLLAAGIGAVSVYDGLLARSERRTEPNPYLVAWGPVAISVGCAAGAGLLLVTTGWAGINLGIAALLGLEALRHVPPSKLPNSRRVVRTYLAANYLGRLAALVPAGTLVLISTGQNYEYVYIGLGVLLVCTALVPDDGFGPDSPASGFNLQTYVLSGFRAVLAGGAIAAVVGFAVLATRSTPLTLAYVALAVSLMRIAVIATSAVTGLR